MVRLNFESKHAPLGFYYLPISIDSTAQDLPVEYLVRLWAAVRQSVHRRGHGAHPFHPAVAIGGGAMSFKFLVRQAVEYTPISEKAAGLYKITRQMPREEQAIDLKYRIKSEAEVYERSVLECQLSSDVRPECEYASTKSRSSQGSHR
jgi:hypothetical protein